MRYRKKLFITILISAALLKCLGSEIEVVLSSVHDVISREWLTLRIKTNTLDHSVHE